ncbi:MAG: helix-turn-helix transcriptional regulator, partial [Clostridia bacterium]|nr:helix-turn-helix transcriptional regulator [Clostridia bacterium]
MVDYQMIGKRIREYRMRRGLTQTALAERAGVEPTNVSHI